jgi:hypothetical protein
MAPLAATVVLAAPGEAYLVTAVWVVWVVLAVTALMAPVVQSGPIRATPERAVRLAGTAAMAARAVRVA